MEEFSVIKKNSVCGDIQIWIFKYDLLSILHPLIQEGQLSVSGELVNRLED